ncbi:transcriptional regulator [Streptomyces sp. NPDC054933]
MTGDPLLADTPAFDVLHALVIKGMAQSRPLAVATARDHEDVLAELEKLQAEGLAKHKERRALWCATPEGKARHTAVLDDDLARDARDRLRPGYERFLPLNVRFKALCTRWQLRDGASNDHCDAAYDQARVTELAALHEEGITVVAQLAAVRPRFGRYAEALTDALTRLRDGETTAFTGVMRGSYHDIWMELHRDLLISLRINREAEERAGTVR